MAVGYKQTDMKTKCRTSIVIYSNLVIASVGQTLIYLQVDILEAKSIKMLSFIIPQRKSTSMILNGSTFIKCS